MDEDLLAAVVERIAGRHQLLRIDSEVVSYLALATKERLRVMTERMIHASQHRRRSLEVFSLLPMYDVDHPMFRIGIGQDVKKQLLAIERVEREEELKHKKHFAELYQQRLIEQGQIKHIVLKDGDEICKGRKKKTVRFLFDPVPNARTKELKVELMEEEKLSFANQTALQFAGSRGRRSTYAWMTPSGGVLKRPLTLAETEGDTVDGVVDPLSSSSSSSKLLSDSVQPSCSLSRSVTRPFDKKTLQVNVQDALFCLEHDCGGKGTGLKVLIKYYIK
ncbi:hypothetical protein BGZ95_009279 [Linnemannia exigua]|uniref:Transcription initiation factor TFIID subunit 4 n=1 Tax=Linnemannia exigua TaxID=604196 RepID=A0AAD4DD28_9FUNG|nr:hypothetical protein BGZ95_009279 [Linnemannia exigua]